MYLIWVQTVCQCQMVFLKDYFLKTDLQRANCETRLYHIELDQISNIYFNRERSGSVVECLS